MKKGYKGMTVNERLFFSGLMDKFDKAVQDEDIFEAKQILGQLELNDIEIDNILKSLNLL